MIATLNKVSQASPLLDFCRKDASEKIEDLRYFADYHPGDPPVTLQPENCRSHFRESYPAVPSLLSLVILSWLLVLDPSRGLPQVTRHWVTQERNHVA